VIRFLIRIVSFLLLLYVLGYAAFAVMLPRPAGDERTDAIVVLTGGSGRLERGFDLVERGISRRMLISGVERTVRPNELAELYHIDPQLFACCVVLGRGSFGTRSNADEVARWVERRHIRSIRLVQRSSHAARRLRAERGWAATSGSSPTPFPVGRISAPSSLNITSICSAAPT
jgi:uncharacterized SAM-binding protein YcdF (DUF218 family)